MILVAPPQRPAPAPALDPGVLPGVDGTVALAPIADSTGGTTLAPIGVPVGLALSCLVLIVIVGAATSILDLVAGLGTLGLTGVWIALRRG